MTQLISRRTLVGGAISLGTAAALDALIVEPRWLEITTHDVPVLGLPRELDGFTIAQITDAHLTRLGEVEEALIEAVQTKNVQLVALTGDIIDSVERFSILRDFSAALRKRGTTIVATLGNWEHWGNVPLESLRNVYEDLSIRLLVNDVLLLEGGVGVAGTDDSTGGTPDIRRARLEENLRARILFTHSPQLFDALPKPAASFHLALAGHTHGGQIRITEHFAPVRPPGSGRYVSGWYTTPIGRAYVSRGTGTSLVPARFSCRPELPLFTLRQG